MILSSQTTTFSTATSDMTIEGRPEFNEKTKEFWKKSFEEQRADRLADSVDEYMQDGEIGRFHEDLTKALQELIDYHEKQKGYAVTAMKAVSGHRPLQMQQDLLPRRISEF